MDRLLTAAVVLTYSLPANAQSLAEAARRAEEARKANGATAVTFDARDVDPRLARQELLGIELDGDLWHRFLAADRAVAAALAGDAAARRRFEALEVSSIRAMERFLQKERPLAEAIAASGGDLHDFAAAHLAVVLAKRERAASTLDSAQLPRAVRANIAFITAHDREVRGLAAPAAMLVLRILPPASSVTAGAPRPDRPVAAASSSEPSASAPGPDADGPIDTRTGAEVPDFRFMDLNGNSRNLSDFRGKHVLLDFWGSWCGPCRAEVPFAKDAYGTLSRARVRNSRARLRTGGERRAGPRLRCRQRNHVHVRPRRQCPQPHHRTLRCAILSHFDFARSGTPSGRRGSRCAARRVARADAGRGTAEIAAAVSNRPDGRLSP